MRFINTLVILALVMTGAAAQAQESHNHGSHATSAGKRSKDHITAKELKQRLDNGDKIIIVDSRSNVGGQMLKGAVHVPSSKLEEWSKTIDKTAIIVTYCTCPHDEASDAQMEKLRDWGFQNAFSLSGGLEAARAAGVEVVKTEE